MKLFALLLLAAAPAGAAELRDLCPDRPGFGTPPCIVDRGHLLVEAGAAFEYDRNADSIDDRFSLGEATLRYGVTSDLEVSVDWTAYEHLRSRDRATGTVSRRGGVGDVRIGLKQSLLSPDGDKVSVAVLPFATIPASRDASRSTQGLIVPASFDLGGDFALGVSPEIDRVPDTMRGGHHAAYANAVELSRQFGTVTAAVEAFVVRDDDPDDAQTTAIVDATLAWQPGDNLQFDAEVDVGLNRTSPDVRLALGFARRF